MTGISDIVVAGDGVGNKCTRFERNARRGDSVPFETLVSILSHDGLVDSYSGNMGNTGGTCANSNFKRV